MSQQRQSFEEKAAPKKGAIREFVSFYKPHMRMFLLDMACASVISLVDTVREQRIPVVFYIEFSSRRTADILAEETGAKPLLFHSCHNVSREEIESGATYLSLMWQNTEALKEALN